MRPWLAMLLLTTFVASAVVSPDDWPVWGGPNRNFIAVTPPLANSWPADGPKKLWTHPIGDGYSGIAVEHGILYTAFVRGSKEVATALDAATGKTVWEYEYENPFKNSNSPSVGPGPYAMPQVIGDRVLIASATGKIQSLDKKTGRPVWSHDLYREFDATHMDFGYSCHPLPYKDTLIYFAGGRGDAVIAFRQSDGAVVWKALDFVNSHSSPLLIHVDGQEQVVALTANEIIGFNPANGEQYWSHPYKTPYGLSVSTPVWSRDNILMVGSAYGLGSRAIELHQSSGKTTVKELWADSHLELHFGSAIARDGVVYIPTGYNGPALLTAVELKTGKILWRDRSFAKTQLVWADGKIVALDEDGMFALLRATPQRLEVLSKVQLLENRAWTPPTIAGTKAYIRDRKTIIALDLK